MTAFFISLPRGGCRGGITADAIGMAKMGPNGRWGNPGRVYALKKCTRKNTQETARTTNDKSRNQAHKAHHDVPCFGALLWR